MTDNEWFRRQRGRRTLEYFLVLTVYADLKPAAGFFGSETMETAIRRVRRPRRRLHRRLGYGTGRWLQETANQQRTGAAGADIPVAGGVPGGIAVAASKNVAGFNRA